MPTLNINGHRVSVDDGFLKLSPDQQNATVEEIAKSLPAQPAGPPADDGLSMARTVTGGVIEGIPIVGPIIRGGVDRAAAATIAGLTDETYDSALKRIQEGTEAEKAANPKLDTAAQITGGVAGTVPAIMAAPAAFGAGGGSLLARSGVSALTGAGIGGTDAAIRSGGDPEAIKSGAKWGLVAGAAGPTVGAVVGKGVKSLIDAGRNLRVSRMAGMKPQALKYLARAVTDDGLDAAGVQSRLAEMGPEAMLADIGPNLQKQAGAIAATPGRGQEIVRTALGERASGANSRINATIDENFGPARIPSAIDAEAAGNQLALSPAYRQAFEQARPYDVGPIASDLERQINVLRGDPQRALQRVRGMLDVHGSNVLDTNPVTMFNTRQAIDGMLKTEADPKVIAALTDARQMIDDGLTRAVPQIKEADAAFAELARQREAVTRGQQVLDSGRTAPRPQELAQEVQEGALPQGMQIGPSAVPLRLSQGARAEIERIVGTNSNDIQAMNRLIKGEGDWNRDRLATLFGPEKADKVFKILENERIFADTNNVVTRNSESAARIAAQNELGGAGGGGFGLKESFKAGGVRGAARSFALDKAESVARALLPDTEGAARESLAKALVGKNSDSVVKALMAVTGPSRAAALTSPVVKALLLATGAAGSR
ncbi:hypothetical protein FHX08_004771 [Rhizobium sp. BK529]|uniref:hypothetical protein n=1 Tax=Rhizobium sp. BK529 TaxID=2586983 RepID=UPI0016153E1C|nr:hypothetical protein [Rhizobium sp. BK529]MBB3594367.1 hypothetical protein [Rhizobium sp. BK529]